MEKLYIIAEAGVNHNGDIEIAKKLIDLAVEAGADAVKFQTFQARNLCVKDAPKARYQKKNNPDESQFEMLKRLELDFEAHKILISHCRKKKIAFMSSPFDIESVDLLAQLNVPVIKIPSGEITNLPYLEKIGTLRKKTILSTGMSNLQEVRDAVNILLSAGLAPKDLSLLHCCTSYPASPDTVNLRAIQALQTAFPDLVVGYSDHTEGFYVTIAAVAIGASVIEKHFTLDRGMEGPDHKASLGPEAFKGMVCALRQVETSLGDGIKQATPDELPIRDVARKSVVALKAIKKGEKFSHFNITAKRPGKGLSPMKWPEIIGQTAKKDFSADEFIEI